eukprot:19777-Heterococcus_DN1.PRE.3
MAGHVFGYAAVGEHSSYAHLIIDDGSPASSSKQFPCLFTSCAQITAIDCYIAQRIPAQVTDIVYANDSQAVAAASNCNQDLQALLNYSKVYSISLQRVITDRKHGAAYELDAVSTLLLHNTACGKLPAM